MRPESLPGKRCPWWGLEIFQMHHLAEIYSRKISPKVIRRIERPAELRQSYNTDALIGEALVLEHYQTYVKVPNACSKPGRIPSNRGDACISTPSASQNEGDKFFSGKIL
jgi:hypothetical protein